MSTSRVKEDMKDTSEILNSLQARNPFREYLSLINVVTGVTKRAGVNAE